MVVVFEQLRLGISAEISSVGHRLTSSAPEAEISVAFLGSIGQLVLHASLVRRGKLLHHLHFVELAQECERFAILALACAVVALALAL